LAITGIQQGEQISRKAGSESLSRVAYRFVSFELIAHKKAGEELSVNRWFSDRFHAEIGAESVTYSPTTH
jgi:hypothetical protein